MEPSEVTHSSAPNIVYTDPNKEVWRIGAMVSLLFWCVALMLPGLVSPSAAETYTGAECLFHGGMYFLWMIVIAPTYGIAWAANVVWVIVIIRGLMGSVRQKILKLADPTSGKVTETRVFVLVSDFSRNQIVLSSAAAAMSLMAVFPVGSLSLDTGDTNDPTFVGIGGILWIASMFISLVTAIYYSTRPKVSIPFNTSEG